MILFERFYYNRIGNKCLILLRGKKFKAIVISLLGFMLTFVDDHVGSIGRAPDYRAGGRGFKLRPDQHSGSLNNGERNAFARTSANG